MTIADTLYLVLVALILVIGLGIAAGILAVVIRLIYIFFRGDLDWRKRHCTATCKIRCGSGG